MESLSDLAFLKYDSGANYIYTFQKEISFPIALPFNLPLINNTNTPVRDIT